VVVFGEGWSVVVRRRVEVVARVAGLRRGGGERGKCRESTAGVYCQPVADSSLLSVCRRGWG
jgi:hypothetical protein